MGLLARIFAPLRRPIEGDAPQLRSIEGEYRPGPYQLPVTGGWLGAEAGSYLNWWQLGFDPVDSSRSAMVEACVSAYSQTVSMCAGDHWRMNDKGGRTRVTTSAASRILRKPNDYQSMSDFMLNATRQLYLTGNTYALALRNDRFEINELHLMDPRQSTPVLAATGDIFYSLSGNHIIDRRIGASPLLVPARDVLHIRLHCSHKSPVPLIGETPLTSALDDIMASTAMTRQQIRFYQNEARPSAVLQTDLTLAKEQVTMLRDRWNEQSKGMAQGGTPILTHGLKVAPWQALSKDARVAEGMKMSSERIALAFRVPVQILGLSGAPVTSTEPLMQQWISTGLGFALNQIEEAFGLLFGMRGQPEEYVEFGTDALLRSAMKDRIESLARAVQGGIYAPNEARAEMGKDAVRFGDEPRVQAQVVPLSAASGIPALPAAPAAPPAPADDAKPDQPKPAPEKDNSDGVQREIRKLRATAHRIGRRFAA